MAGIQGVLDRFLLGFEQAMAFLPKELASAKERTGGLLPADDGAPLVVALGKIAIRRNQAFVHIAEKDFRSWADHQGIVEFLASADGGDQRLRGKAFDMLFFLVEQGHGDDGREINVARMQNLFEFPVEVGLDLLPHRIGIGKVINEAFDGGIVHQLRFAADVGVPLREIHIAGGDGIVFLIAVVRHICCAFLKPWVVYYFFISLTLRTDLAGRGRIIAS